MKSLVQTPEIIKKLQASIGPDVALGDLNVYEAVSLNTLPLNKSGSIYDKGVASTNTLSEMAGYLQAGDSVPVILMHDGSALPVGKVFSGEVRQSPNGLPELRTLFYVPTSEAAVIAKLESSVVDEVSVGLLPAHLNCSTCGWDYFGADATMTNLYDRTCANDHVVGIDGCHVVMNGMATWIEQSLVGRGAANHAKIVGRSASVLSPESQQKLAASGQTEANLKALFATVTKEQSNSKDNSMDLTALVKDLTDAKVDLKMATDKIAALEAEVSTQAAKVAEFSTKNDELSMQLTAAQSGDVAVLKIENETLKASNELATSHLKTLAQRALVASGVKDAVVPDDLNKAVEVAVS